MYINIKKVLRGTGTIFLGVKTLLSPIQTLGADISEYFSSVLKLGTGVVGAVATHEVGHYIPADYLGLSPRIELGIVNVNGKQTIGGVCTLKLKGGVSNKDMGNVDNGGLFTNQRIEKIGTSMLEEGCITDEAQSIIAAYLVGNTLAKTFSPYHSNDLDNLESHTGLNRDLAAAAYTLDTILNFQDAKNNFYRAIGRNDKVTPRKKDRWRIGAGVERFGKSHAALIKARKGF